VTLTLATEPPPLGDTICNSCPVLETCATDQTVQQSDGFRHGVLFTRDHNRGSKPTPRSLNPPKRIRLPRARPVAVERSHKRCPRCREDLTIDNYAMDRTRSDGRSAYCKPCRHTAELLRKQRSAA
jgi:hypothetical protein